MALLVGIDEAGYGPLLGPLVVSSAAFTVPDELLKSDMWKVLKGAVSKSKRGLSGRLLIADSKKVFNRKAGCGHLRRGVISAIRCLDRGYEIPTNVKELAEILCPASLERLHDYDWYQELEKIELGGENSDFDIATGVFSRELSKNGMSLVGLSSDCLDVGYYNEMVSNVRNKARVLFTSVASLIVQAYDSVEDGGRVQVVVDRQGGRISLCIVRQDTKCSSYELGGEGKQLRIHFVVKADSISLPVSLASMTSKYIREVMMESISRYFLSHCSEIEPTAGYWQDGQRFIKDLEEKAGSLRYNAEKLIRSR